MADFSSQNSHCWRYVGFQEVAYGQYGYLREYFASNLLLLTYVVEKLGLL